MIKKVITSFVIFFFLLSNQTFAHTGLEDSTPKDGEVIKEPIQQITLSFATKVEQTSTIEILNSDGESVNLGNFVIEDSEIWATFLQPLENDNYKVIWKIVGTDGHPINGDFSFTVEAPEEPQKNEQTEEDTNQTEGSPKQQNEDKAINETEKEGSQTEQKFPAYLIPSIVVVLAIVGVGFLWWVLRRK